ncbi:MAG: leucyl/phenylalanyl-tRNA--protein transferase [Propionibacteriaceae bacterium]|jgi:leucyl/phenylalanyl-tRNA--protein transferase|nr:leucyl/phenylalanyl-tRNA--protein transferase [Propionibacteriaceae bacterium]
MGLWQVFGPPEQWPDEDLVAFSDSFDQDLVLAAYRSGVFPMPLKGAFFRPRMAWWSPVRRGVLEPRRLRVARSLRQSAKRYRVTFNRAFPAVLEGCADPRRPSGWIDDDIRSVYRALFDQGVVVSVETWTKAGQLAGGLYGVSIGGLFAGESMFHRADIGRDASKVALLALAGQLADDGADRLIDVQWATPHLESLGATTLSRRAYLRRLDALLEVPAPRWPTTADHVESVAGGTP